jgi:hypothetical protein
MQQGIKRFNVEPTMTSSIDDPIDLCLTRQLGGVFVLLQEKPIQPD